MPSPNQNPASPSAGNLFVAGCSNTIEKQLQDAFAENVRLNRENAQLRTNLFGTAKEQKALIKPLASASRL